MQGLGLVMHAGPDRSRAHLGERRRRAASGSLRCFGSAHIVINTRRAGPRDPRSALGVDSQQVVLGQAKSGDGWLGAGTAALLAGQTDRA